MIHARYYSIIKHIMLATIMLQSWVFAAPPAIEGNVSQWQGFERHDFKVAERDVTVVVPKTPAKGAPWLWRAEFFGAFATVDVALLNKGFYVVYMNCADTFGDPETMQKWSVLYDLMTGQYQLSKKPVLLGMSRGGLYVYNWAAQHPDKVGLIYGDAPVCDVTSWPGGKGHGKGSAKDWELFKTLYGLSETQAMEWKGNPINELKPIADAHIPIIHVCGTADDAVPEAENTLVLKKRYEALGGKLELIEKPGVGHHPHSLADPTPIVDFILKNRLPD